MTQQFICEPFSERDERGRLESVGVRWTEEASWRSGTNKLLILFSMVVSAAVTIFTFASASAMPTAPLFSVLFVAVFVWCCFYVFAPLPRREVLFHPDGSISVPHGTPRNPGARALRIRQPEILSIEVIGAISGNPQDWTKGVAIITTDGHTVPVGKRLHSEEARQVSVALSLALQRMRSAVRPQDSAVAGERQIIN